MYVSYVQCIYQLCHTLVIITITTTTIVILGPIIIKKSRLKYIDLFIYCLFYLHDRDLVITSFCGRLPRYH